MRSGRCGNDHRLHIRVAQHGLKIAAGLQVTLKRSHLGGFGSAGDGPAQINLGAQIVQAQQVRHRTRANTHQRHAHGFHDSAFRFIANDCACKANSHTLKTWAWVMQVSLRSATSAANC